MNKSLKITIITLFLMNISFAKDLSFYFKVANDTNNSVEFHKLNLKKSHIEKIIEDENTLKCSYNMNIENAAITLNFEITLGDGDYSPLGLMASSSIDIDKIKRSFVHAPFSSILKMNTLPTLVLGAPYAVATNDFGASNIYFGFASSIKKIDNIMAGASEYWDKTKVQNFTINEKVSTPQFNCTL